MSGHARIGRRGLILSAAAVVLAPAARAADPLDPAQVFGDPDAPVLGDPRGDATVVAFFDYQCPYCKAAHPVLMEEVARDGRIRLVMKDWPIFGAPSVEAAQLALGAAALGRYAAATDALMGVEGRLTPGRAEAALKAAGVDPAAASRAYRRGAARWTALLRRNAAQAEAFGFPGTPAYVIGFEVYRGAIDRATLRAAVDRARDQT